MVRNNDKNDIISRFRPMLKYCLKNFCKGKSGNENKANPKSSSKDIDNRPQDNSQEKIEQEYILGMSKEEINKLVEAYINTEVDPYENIDYRSRQYFNRRIGQVYLSTEFEDRVNTLLEYSSNIHSDICALQDKVNNFRLCNNANESEKDFLEINNSIEKIENKLSELRFRISEVTSLFYKSKDKWNKLEQELEDVVDKIMEYGGTMVVFQRKKVIHLQNTSERNECTMDSYWKKVQLLKNKAYTYTKINEDGTYSVIRYNGHGEPIDDSEVGLITVAELKSYFEK